MHTSQKGENRFVFFVLNFWLLVEFGPWKRWHVKLFSIFSFTPDYSQVRRLKNAQWGEVEIWTNFVQRWRFVLEPSSVKCKSIYIILLNASENHLSPFIEHIDTNVNQTLSWDRHFSSTRHLFLLPRSTFFSHFSILFGFFHSS